MPADVFCKYNCGILGTCSALNSLTIDNKETATFTMQLPQSEIRRISDRVTKGASCRNPDWTELKFATTDAFVSYQAKEYEKVPALPLGVRLLGTPFSVALDIVTSPVQIVVGVIIFVVYDQVIRDMSGGRRGLLW